MAIDPYITRKASRPAPVKSAGWAGRNSTGIVPYGSFDAATLREAIAIIDGSSPYYHFDAQGVLKHTKSEQEPVDHYYHRQRFRAQFIERMHTAGRWDSFVEEESRIRQGRIGEIRAKTGHARKAYDVQFESIASQFHGTYDDGTPYFDMPALWQWESRQKADPASPLAQKEAAVLKEIEDSAPERMELGEISADQQIHERDEKLLADFQNFDALLEQLRHASAEADSDTWNHKKGETAVAISERLHKAALLFDDASYYSARERINQASTGKSDPISPEAKEEFDQKMAELGEFFNWDGNRDTDTLEVLRAALAILANAARQQGYDPISEAIRLNVRAKDSPMGRTLEEMSSQFSMMDDDGDPIRWGMDDDTRRSSLREMEGDIVQLRKLDAGAQKPEIKDNSDDPYYDPEAAEYHNETRWDKKQLLRHLMSGAQWQLEDPTDLMRFHNQFPEAISFILASHEGEFLMHEDGRNRNIRDIPNFLNSYWMSLAGDAEATVSPELLAATRAILRTQTMRELEPAAPHR